MEIIIMSAGLASIYILTKLLIYIIGRRKIQLPELFLWKASILELLFLTVAYYVFFELIIYFENIKVTDFLVYLFIFIFLSLIRFYSFIIEPITVFKNKNVKRSIKLEEENKAILNGARVFTFKGNFSNAYAIGVLNFAQGIIISQDLVSKMSSYELSGIIAHEIGHLKNKHLFKLYLSTIFALLLGYVLFIFMSPYVEELNYNVHILRGLQGAIFYGIPLWLIPSLYQRKLELQADAFAAKLTSKKCIIASLEKLDCITDGMVSKGGDTHPSLKERLNNILRL